MKRKLGSYSLMLAGVVVLLGSTSPVLAEGVTRGAMLANGCAGCHGTDGRGSGRIPRINDLPKQDMVEIMKGFREGLGRPTVMDRHAKGFTDEEVGLIADYFASLKKK